MQKRAFYTFTLCFLGVCLLLSTNMTFAQTNAKDERLINGGDDKSSWDNAVDRKILDMRESLLENSEYSYKEIQELRKLLEEQKGTITVLQNQLQSSATKQEENNNMTFEAWSSIALAVSAIVLTGVAIMVGIGSFWGMREIKDSANRSAKETAEHIVKTLVPLAVAESTEEELFNLIDNGRLDHVVDEIMQKIIYKDVGFEDDIPAD